MADTVKNLGDFEDYLLQLPTSKFERIIARMFETEICPNCKEKMILRHADDPDEKEEIVLECPKCRFSWGD